MLKHQSSSIPNLGLPPKGENNLLILPPIDGDIRSQATDFVKKQFSVIPFVNDQQKDQIARWLAEHVQTERMGWSKKMELSIREIEKQRRGTLLNNSRIQTINSQVEHMIQKEATEADTKFADDNYDVILELEQNVMTLCSLVGQLLDDRTQCLKLLGISEKQMHEYEYVADLLRQKMNSFDGEIRRLRDEKDDNLQTPRSQVSIVSKIDPATPRRAGVSKGGKKNKGEPPDRFLSLKPVETVNLIPLVVSHDVNSEKRVMAGKNRKKRKDSLDGKKRLHLRKEVEIDDKKKAKSDPELMLGKLEVQKITPISPDEKTRKQEEMIEVLKLEMKELEVIVLQKDKDLEKYKHHIKTLKHLYHYGNLGLKGGKYKESNFMRTNDAAKFTQKDSLSVMSHSLPAIGPENINQNGNEDVGLSLDSILFPPAKTSVSRCLRCKRLYRLQDNHKKACRYHPKSKRKVEKYSDNGKLQNVTFVWDCCHGDAENDGCCADEHI
ncbi:uncharacterized protein LOC135502857 [Lineus longissimus]|uniref:uncharacterized protein LOC135502857 n=1 Tax=Lineus longissimus TaxID=88925 RepID=UPI00315D5F8F